MARCKYCDIANRKEKARVLYEDDVVIAILSDEPVNPGHVLLFPKEHFLIFEQVPDAVIKKMSPVINKISIALFESLGALGTNVLIQNGVAAGQSSSHFMIHIIPRFENDNLNFQWETKKLSDEDMSMAELKLKEQVKRFTFEEEKQEPMEIKENVEGIKQGEGINYMIEQLKRIP